MAPHARERLTPLPMAAWPASDRTAWDKLFQPRVSLFGDGGEGLRLRPHTRRNYRRGYGIWLAFLAGENRLDPDAPPAARTTPGNLDAWIADMRQAGCRNSTIAGYLRSLHATLRLIAPAADLGFILKPRGVPLSVLLPAPPKPFPPHDTEEVMHHVRALHRRGLAANSDHARRTALRDAALMALFLRRAPRVSTVASMRLGEHLQEQADQTYLCRFPAADTKAKREIVWPLDPECSAMVRDYLCLGRPLFSGATATDHLWLGNQAMPLAVAGLQAMFMRRTREWLGVALCPHTARKWLRTTAARRSPEAAFDAAEVMGHSPQVSLRHYADATETGAIQRHARRLHDLRRATASLAARSYRKHPGSTESTRT